MSNRSFRIRNLITGDLEFIADNMRKADMEELAAASGARNYLSRLTLSAELSDEVRVVEADSVPLLVFGTARLSEGSKAVWLLGTRLVQQWRDRLAHEAEAVIHQWFAADPTLKLLTNYTYTKNRVYRRFLEQLGAEVGPAEAVGACGALFHRFNIRRDAHV